VGTGASNECVQIDRLKLGPFNTNSYLLTCPLTGDSVVVDAPAEASEILRAAKETNPKYILITHNHMDHVGALSDLRSKLKLIFNSSQKIVKLFQADRYTGKVLGTTKCSLRTSQASRYLPYGERKGYPYSLKDLSADALACAPDREFLTVVLEGDLLEGREVLFDVRPLEVVAGLLEPPV